MSDDQDLAQRQDLAVEFILVALQQQPPAILLFDLAGDARPVLLDDHHRVVDRRARRHDKQQIAREYAESAQRVVRHPVKHHFVRVPAFDASGLIDNNAIAVFTAMGMCWSGFLSTHTGMLDSLGYRQLISKAIISHTVGGLLAGISAHWLYVLLSLF